MSIAELRFSRTDFLAVRVKKAQRHLQLAVVNYLAGSLQLN